MCLTINKHKSGLFTFVLLLAFFAAASCQAQELEPPQYNTPYGDNKNAGRLLQINDIKLYVEIYGKGMPLLLLHGNAADISTMAHQIEFFASDYQIIAPDSRGHGKSEMGKARLTYVQMADDMNAMLEQLKLKSVNVIGWSDGGIVALLLAIHYPDKVAKVAVMGSNLNPQGAYDWALKMVAREDAIADQMIAKGDKSKPWPVVKQYLDLLGKQPNIAVESLQHVKTPVLVMAGDRDVIRDTHTLDIFHALPQSQLVIFPGATHMIPWENPALFNKTVQTFLDKPFLMPTTQAILDPDSVQ